MKEHSTKMEHTRQSAVDNEALRQQLALGHGFELYAQYTEKEAASFLSLHSNTLKKLRQTGEIGFLKKGERAIAYLGFQLADYLITKIEPCQTPKPEIDTKSETIGSHKGMAKAHGIEPGSIPRADKHAVYRLALQTLNVPEKY